MKDKLMMVGGLEHSGKTSFICSILTLAKKKNLSYAGFKPFDNGLLARYALEQNNDGTAICQHMLGEPMETLVSPYIAHEMYPIEMAFRRDGLTINWGFIDKRLNLLNEHYDGTLVELPPGLFTPITEEKMVCDWIREKKTEVVWIVHPLLEQFEQNLIEIQFLKNLGVNIHFVMNNASDTRDQDLVFYIWEKIEKLANQEIEGMIPFLQNSDNRIEEISDKLEKNLPMLSDFLVSATPLP